MWASTDAGESAAGHYFACSDQHPTYAELGRMTADAVGRRHVFLFHMAEPLPWLVAGVAQVIARLAHQAQVVNLDKMRESIQPSWAASPRAIREELGFTEPYSLRQRLDQTAAWYRETGVDLSRSDLIRLRRTKKEIALQMRRRPQAGGVRNTCGGSTIPVDDSGQ